jgi:aminopeptidase N
MRRLVRIANCLLWCAMVPLSATAAPLARPYTVENYDVSIRADLTRQRLYGEVTIRFHSVADTATSALELDAGRGLEVASVVEGQASQSFEQDHGLLFVVVTNPLRMDQPRTITVRYEAGPAPGLKFFPDQVYTSATSDWMPCNDRPGERATLHLTIAAPSDTKAAGSGQLYSTRAGEGQSQDQSITEWRLDSPAGPSWFGFALGRFEENTSEAEGVKLRVLGAATPSLEPVAAAMHFLAERAGKPFPGQTYTQVFIHGDAIRSMAAGLTLLPESYSQGLDKQPEKLRVMTKQLARQWYGIEIAVNDWSDLWLSDGVSAFLADAFLGEKFGKEAYEREIQRSEQIFNRLRAEGRDRPLSDTGWTTREEAGGDIAEYKGVAFLFLVSQTMGDSAFRDGLRLYTSDEWGKAASSADLQRALDALNTGNAATGAGQKKKSGNKSGNKSRTSAKALDSLFDLWVYGIPSADTKSKKSR